MQQKMQFFQLPLDHLPLSRRTKYQEKIFAQYFCIVEVAFDINITKSFQDLIIVLKSKFKFIHTTNGGNAMDNDKQGKCTDIKNQILIYFTFQQYFRSNC